MDKKAAILLCPLCVCQPLDSVIPDMILTIQRRENIKQLCFGRVYSGAENLIIEYQMVVKEANFRCVQRGYFHKAVSSADFFRDKVIEIAIIKATAVG